MQKDGQERGTVVRGRERRYRMGKWGIGGLEIRVGRECSISREGPDSTVEVYMSEESEEGLQCYGREGSSKSENCQELGIWIKKVVSILDEPIWSKRSIALTCPARSHFQRTHSRER